MAYVGLSRAYSGLDDPAAAISSLEKLDCWRPQASDWNGGDRNRAKQLEAIADLQQPCHRHTDYKRAIDEALAININDTELWLLRGNARRRPRPDAASAAHCPIAFTIECLPLSPDNLPLIINLIHSYENIGQYRMRSSTAKFMCVSLIRYLTLII